MSCPTSSARVLEQDTAQCPAQHIPELADKQEGSNSLCLLSTHDESCAASRSGAPCNAEGSTFKPTVDHSAVLSFHAAGIAATLECLAVKIDRQPAAVPEPALNPASCLG